VKRLVKLVLVVGVIAALLALLKRRPAPPSASPTAPPTRPAPTQRPGPVDAPLVTPSTAAGEPPSKDVAPAWADASGERTCPDGYPIKAKLSSKVFHVPGGSMYDRTTPDRCYATAEAAEADGFRQSKR
jgi:hypothetical protein